MLADPGGEQQPGDGEAVLRVPLVLHAHKVDEVVEGARGPGPRAGRVLRRGARHDLEGDAAQAPKLVRRRATREKDLLVDSLHGGVEDDVRGLLQEEEAGGSGAFFEFAREVDKTGHAAGVVPSVEPLE